MVNEDFNPYVSDTIIAEDLTSQEIVVTEKCSRIELEMIVDTAWLISDSYATIRINHAGNTPLLTLFTKQILENVDGQITKLFVTTPTNCFVSVKQFGGYVGIDRRI